MYGNQQRVGYVAGGERGYSGSSGMSVVPIDDGVDGKGQHNRPVGWQGLGINAGSRIMWQWDGDMQESFPVYYNNATSLEGEKGEGNEDGGEGPEQQALEYMGCFRDYPGDRREFYIEEASPEPSDSEETEAENGMEGGAQRPGGQDDTVFMYPASLTPNVRDTTRSTSTYIGLCS